jgi:hypothetical protein
MVPVGVGVGVVLVGVGVVLVGVGVVLVGVGVAVASSSPPQAAATTRRATAITPSSQNLLTLFIANTPFSIVKGAGLDVANLSTQNTNSY